MKRLLALLPLVVCIACIPFGGGSSGTGGTVGGVPNPDKTTWGRWNGIGAIGADPLFVHVSDRFVRIRLSLQSGASCEYTYEIDRYAKPTLTAHWVSTTPSSDPAPSVLPDPASTLSLRLELGDEPLVAGLGGYLSTQSLREVGYFEAAGIGLNSYENAQRGTFFGPLLQAGYAWNWSFLQLSLEARLVPYFWFKAAQEITIEPLVATSGTNSYAGTGFPYVYLRVNPRLFTFLSPEIEYEFQRFTFEALEATNGSPNWTWTKAINAYDSHTLALRGNIYIPLGGDQYIELGYGQKLKWLLPEGKPALHSAQGIFKLAYRFHK